MARARAKAPKKKTSLKKAGPTPRPEPLLLPAGDRSLQEMQAEAARTAAQRRVAAFLERTANLPWMRHRLGSFEKALLGGLKNLLAEAERDEAENRSSESYAAHYAVLYGMFTSLQHLFFWKAIEARVADISARQQRAPETSDTEDVLQELNIFHSAAIKDVNQAHFRRMLAQDETSETVLRRRIREQARAYDLLNPLKDIPKA